MPPKRSSASQEVLELRDRLAQAIVRGRFLDRLPGERRLARHYHLPLRQVRHALGLLEQDGLIERHPGRAARILPAAGAPTEPARLIDRIVLLHRLRQHSVFGNWMMLGMQQAARRVSLVVVGRPLEEIDWDAIEQRMASSEGRRTGWALLNLEPDETQLRRWRRAEYHVVLIDSLPAVNVATNAVVFDQSRAVRMAVQRLVELGHRQIGFVGEVDDSVAAERLAGFHRVLKESGISESPDHNAVVHISRPGGDWDIEASVRRLLARPDRPTALVAFSQRTGSAVLEICRDRGVVVPREMSVIAAGANYLMSTSPELTAIDQGRPEDLGELAVYLLTRADAAAHPLALRLAPRLIERTSTAPPP